MFPTLWEEKQRVKTKIRIWVMDRLFWRALGATADGTQRGWRVRGKFVSAESWLPNE